MLQKLSKSLYLNHNVIAGTFICFVLCAVFRFLSAGAEPFRSLVVCGV